MTRSSNAAPRELAALIEDEFLRHAAGSMDILFDDLVVVIRKQRGLTLSHASRFLHQHLSRALKHLSDRDWKATKCSAYWFDDADLIPPDNERDIVRCLAGPGKRTVGLHFTKDRDDWLFVYARDWNIRNGEGKTTVNIEAIKDVAEAKLLSREAAMTAVRATVNRTGTIAQIEEFSGDGPLLPPPS